jgi:Trk K+ transport system NAD-binding subunit
MIFIFPEYNFWEMSWINFLRTLDPGTLAGDTGTFTFVMMMTVMTFVGILVFSLFISFILNGFQSKLETLRKGRSKVIEKNHVVILGNNTSLPVIIGELVLANENKKRSVVVVLSDSDPVEVSSGVKEFIKDFKTTKVIYRKGSIYDVDDLIMCSISKAKVIILIEQDITIIKALVALHETQYFSEGSGKIAALFQNIETMEAARKLVGDRGLFIYVEDAITKIIAQSCLQLGLSRIYNNLFDFGGDEIYTISSQELAGKSYLEIQKKFSKSIVIGYIRDNETYINPDPKEVIGEDDLILVITEDDDTAVPEVTVNQFNQAAIKPYKRKSGKEIVSILFIGYNKKVDNVIAELDNYVLPGSSLTIITENKSGIESLTKHQSDYHNISINIKEANTTDKIAIKDTIDGINRSVVIFHNEDANQEDKDAETLLTLLHLRNLEKECDKKLEVITEIYDVKNTKIIEMAKVDDLVISNQLTNRMLTQVAENPFIVDVLNILLNPIGSEVYLKAITDYIDTDVEVDAYTLIEACAVKGETFLGYKNSCNDSDACIFMNPNKANKVRFNKDDKIIVLSSD